MEQELSLLMGLRTAHRHRILPARWHRSAQQPLKTRFSPPSAQPPSPAPLPGTVLGVWHQPTTLAAAGMRPSGGGTKGFPTGVDLYFNAPVISTLGVIVMFQLHKFYRDCSVCDASVEYAWDMLSKNRRIQPNQCLSKQRFANSLLSAENWLDACHFAKI